MTTPFAVPDIVAATNSRPLRRGLALVAGLLASLLAVDPAAALNEVPTYRVLDIASHIRALDASLTGNVSNDVNAQSDACGWAVLGGKLRPWAWIDGGVLLLPVTPERDSGQAVAVSDRRPDGTVLVVGNLQTNIFDEPGIAWLWRVDVDSREVLESRALPSLEGSLKTVATAVSSAGLVLGTARYPLPLPSRAVVYDDSTGQLRELDFPAFPSDINNSGEIVGGTWFGDIHGNYVDVGVPEGSTTAALSALNDVGQAAGTLAAPYTDGAGRFVHRFGRYNGQAWDLVVDASAFGGAYDITNDGDVLGTIGAGGSIVPVLYVAATGTLASLTSMLAPEYTGDAVYSAGAINNAGVVAASLTDGAALLLPEDSLGPELAFVDPADGSNVYRRSTIRVVAADTSPVEELRVTWNCGSATGDLCREFGRSDLRCRWNTRRVPTGPCTLVAEARDGLGNASTASIDVAVADADPSVLYVGRIRLRARDERNARAKVVLFDGRGRRSSADAEITWRWTLPDGSTREGSSSAVGGKLVLAVDASDAVGPGGFSLGVTDVVAAGYGFDPTAGMPRASAP